MTITQRVLKIWFDGWNPYDVPNLTERGKLAAKIYEARTGECPFSAYVQQCQKDSSMFDDTTQNEATP